MLGGGVANSFFALVLWSMTDNGLIAKFAFVGSPFWFGIALHLSLRGLIRRVKETESLGSIFQAGLMTILSLVLTLSSGLFLLLSFLKMVR